MRTQRPESGPKEKGSLSGVVKIVGQTQLPQEFITIGKNFEEALTKIKPSITPDLLKFYNRVAEWFRSAGVDEKEEPGYFGQPEYIYPGALIATDLNI